MGCVALLLTTSAVSQPSNPFFITCTETPDWSGLGIPDEDDYWTIAGLVCPTLATEEGKYAYWGEEPPFGTETTIPSGTTFADDIYGFKGHGGIGNSSNNPALKATVFETQMQLLENVLQTPSNPEFTFRTGKFEFDFVVADFATTITIAEGATVTINHGLVLMQNSTINVEEGGTLILSADPEIGSTCIIDDRGGSITGRIQRQLHYTLPNFEVDGVWEAGSTSEELFAASFTLASGLVEVNMHQLAQMIQDTVGFAYLDGSVERPTVQISSWGHREDFAEEFPYLANNAYMNMESWENYIQEFDEIFEIEETHTDNQFGSYYYWGGPVALDGGSYITVVTDEEPWKQKRISTIGKYGFDKHSGIGTMPLYKNNEGTLADLFSNEQLLRLASGATGGTDEYQATVATTSDQRGWLIHLTEIPLDVIANSSETALIFTVEGVYPGDQPQVLQNTNRLIQDSKEHDPSDGIFQDTLYDNFVDASGFFPIELYTEEDFLEGVQYAEISYLNPNDEGNGAYHFIDMTGFNLIRNNTNNFVPFSDIAAQITNQAPYSQLAFYDVSGLATSYNTRTVEEIDIIEHNDVGEAHSLYHQYRLLDLPMISNLMRIPATSNTGTFFVDVLNYTEVDVDGEDLAPIGASSAYLKPGQVVGFNFHDPYSATRYDLDEITVDLGQIDAPVTYKNMGGVEITDIPLEFNGVMYNAAELIEQDFYWSENDNESYMRTTNENGVVSAERNTINKPIFGIEELDDQNIVTLLELHGENEEGAFLLATIPLAFNPLFNGSEVNSFQSSAGVHPGFHLINPNPDKSASTAVGAFGRGTDTNVDSLRLFFNPAFFAGEYESMSMRVQVAQTPNPAWNHPWHWRLATAEYTMPEYALHSTDRLDLEIWDGDLIYPHDDFYGGFNVGLDSEYEWTTNGGEDISIFTLYSCWNPADVTFDGCVFISDIIELLAVYSLNNNDAGYDVMFDINADGVIGNADLLYFLGVLNSCWLDEGTPDQFTEIESPLITNGKTQRLKDMVEFRNVARTHSPYNIWTDYAWPDQQVKTILQNKLTISNYDVYVADEFGWVHHGQPLGDGTINLPSRVPTNAELQAVTPDLGTAFPTGLRIYLKCHEKLSLNGYPAETNMFCLGCSTTEVPGNPTTTLPEFD